VGPLSHAVFAVALAAGPPPGADPRAYEGPAAAGSGAAAVPARAEAPGARAPASGQAPEGNEPDADADAGAGGGRRVLVIEPRTGRPTEPWRAATVVRRETLEERLPRSAPDAIRYEPGVYVQQTAHSQASPYVRGLTGQQVVLYFDDVRLNNSTFRQGPNQYFFTVDARTLDRVEVVRGSASVRYGADALGGAILSTPIDPGRLPHDPTIGQWPRFALHPRLLLRTQTADGEIGGRVSLDARLGRKVTLLVGAGGRDVGNLRAGGQLIAPGTGMVEKIPPHFDDDGKTQLGTGFREWTADARLVARPAPGHEIVAAYYDYRQLDAPRTDKCPPPEAPLDACLRYEQQFRTLGYVSWRRTDGPPAAHTVRVTLHGQRQRERRDETRGGNSPTRLSGRDDVYTAGLRAVITTDERPLGRRLRLSTTYGADLYQDVIRSRASIHWSDTDITADLSRGQYLDGSLYLQMGTFGESRLHVGRVLMLRAGGRAGLTHARAEGDPDTESKAVRRTWGHAVGGGGFVVRPIPQLAVVGNLDQGYRAPNLDDLTSRQQTGPGFQRENADLRPERSLTLEGGVRVRHPVVEIDGFVYRLWVHDLIQRRPFDATDCPVGDPGCASSRTRFQLQNADGAAKLWGVEGALVTFLPWDLFARATVSYAFGDMPNPVEDPDEPTVPMSRVPPLNGTVEAGYRSRATGFHAVAALRWATLQDRLAPADRADPRIPTGGTPGYVVVDLRAGYRFDPYALVSLVFENVGDAAYRMHGSSVNGPGRSLIVHVELGF